MLAGGTLTATVTSRKTGRHVTLRFQAKRKVGKWTRCAFEEASHVFVSDFDGELLATYYPRDGVARFEASVTDAVRWSALAVLRHLSGAFPKFDDVAELFIADFCGRCGRPLVDPESIERGFGPECFGFHTTSRAAAVRAA